MKRTRVQSCQCLRALSVLQRVLIATQLCQPGREETRCTSADLLCSPGVSRRKRSVTVESLVGFSRLVDGAYSRFRCFGGGEEVAFQPRSDHSGGANWSRLTSLVDDVSPDGASCRREGLLATGIHDGPYL